MRRDSARDSAAAAAPVAALSGSRVRSIVARSREPVVLLEREIERELGSRAQMVAQRFPRRAWRIDCAAEPTICHHAPAGSVPFFEAPKTPGVFRETRGA